MTGARFIDRPTWTSATPGPSAVVLAAAVHLQRTETGRFEDRGIRSHGSHDYTSVGKRYSHGCHRLFNHTAQHLYGFILRRSPHRATGPRTASKTRRFRHDGRNYRIDLESDGSVFVLDKPLSVTTLPGTVQGEVRAPFDGYLPRPDVVYGPDARFVSAVP